MAKYRQLKRILDEGDSRIPRDSLRRVRTAMMDVEFRVPPPYGILRSSVEIMYEAARLLCSPHSITHLRPSPSNAHPSNETADHNRLQRPPIGALVPVHEDGPACA